MAQSSWRWAFVIQAALLTGLVNAVPALAQDEGKAADTAPPPRPLSTVPITSVQGVPIPPHGCPAPEQVIQGPIVSEGQSPPRLTQGQVQPGDVPLSINLPTALRLADARPLLIAAAQASLQLALAQWQRARVLWIPRPGP